MKEQVWDTEDREMVKRNKNKGKERKEKGHENLGNVEDVEMEYFLGKQTVISIFFWKYCDIILFKQVCANHFSIEIFSNVKDQMFKYWTLSSQQSMLFGTSELGIWFI